MVARALLTLRTLEYVFGRRKRRSSPPPAEAIALAQAARRASAITPEELPAVVAVRTLIADMVALCPLVHLGRDGQPKANPSPIVTMPDPFESPFDTHHRSVMELTGAGRTWLMPTARNPKTSGVVALTVLDDDQVTPIEDYTTGRILGCRWRDRELLTARMEVVHVPFIVTSRHRVGRSALGAARPAMDAVAEAYNFARSTWAEGGAPSVVLEVPWKVEGKTEADELRQAWLDTHGGRRVPAVMSLGAKASPFAVQDATDKLALALAIISAECPRVYRVPPSLVNAWMVGSLTYTTTAQEMTRFITTCLRSYLRRLEHAYSSLLPRGETAKFDTSVLTEDLAAEAAASKGETPAPAPSQETAP